MKDLLLMLEKGLKLIPLKARGKTPLFRGWQNEATNDLNKIERWLTQYPNMNIGVVTGETSGVLVVDIDNKPAADGTTGLDTLKRLKAKGFSFETLTVKTGGGGFHFYYKMPKNKSTSNLVRALNGIDIRTNGGFVVAPPSIHESGTKYEFINDLDIAELPEDLYNELFNKSVKNNNQKKCQQNTNSIEIGSRNDTLFRKACELNRAGLPQESTLSEIKRLNELNCITPLSNDEIEGIVNSAYSYTVDFPYSDMGNAQRLVHKFKDKIRYCSNIGAWFIYNGKKWEQDTSNQIVELAKETVRCIILENNSNSNEKSKQKHYLNSQSEQRIKAMIKLAASTKEIVITSKEFDNEEHLLNCQNGIVNLQTGELTPHNPLPMNTKMINIKYTPEAKSELWEKFLNEISSENLDFLNYLQMMTGYAFTGNTTEQGFFILYGAGCNGKSVFAETIKEVLGEYATTTSSSTFITSRYERVRNDLAALEGTRLTITSESNEYDNLDEAILKSITGGEAISARKLYKEYYTFVPKFKVWFISNYLPNIRAGGYSIERRLKPINFEYTVPKEKIDKNLLQKLKKEENQEAILAWAVKGAINWYKGGLPEWDKIKKNAIECLNSNNIVIDFIDKCLIQNDDTLTLCTEVHLAFSRYCKEMGIRPLNKGTFGKKLAEQGIISDSIGSKRYYKVTLLAVNKPAFTAQECEAFG